jgi:uncharacterized protein YbcI
MATVRSSAIVERRDGLAERIAALHLKHLGHRPRQVDLHLFDGLLVVLIAGFATRLERTLGEHGRRALVLACRDALLPVIEPELRGMVEETFRRGVCGCTSAVDPEADVATLLLLLEPRGADLHSRVRSARADSAALRSDSRALRAQSEQALRRASQVIGKGAPRPRGARLST